MSEATCIETRIHRGGDGKVAIVDYGKISSGYSVNVTRTYTVPEDWDEAQIEAFELAKLAEFKDRIDPILDAEFQERWDQHVWEGDK